jgi:hypothetical protein
VTAQQDRVEPTTGVKGRDRTHSRWDWSGEWGPWQVRLVNREGGTHNRCDWSGERAPVPTSDISRSLHFSRSLTLINVCCFNLFEIELINKYTESQGKMQMAKEKILDVDKSHFLKRIEN